MKSDRLIDFNGVYQLTSLSRSSVNDLEKAGNFPKRINFGSAVRWSFREVSAWVETKKSERSAA